MRFLVGPQSSIAPEEDVRELDPWEGVWLAFRVPKQGHVRCSTQKMIAEALIRPGGIFGRERWIGIEPVIEEMISAPLVALVNEWLEIQDHVGIGRAQRNANGRQAFAQADGIDFALDGSLGSKDTDAIAGGFLLEDIPNALRENGGALAHQV